MVRLLSGLLLALMLSGCGDSNEVVDYPIFCAKESLDKANSAICTEGWVTGNRSAYKVNFEKQEVVQSLIGFPSITRYTKCAIWDAQNWECGYESGPGKIEFKQGMRKKFERTDLYSVNRACWWYVKMYSHVQGRLPAQLPLLVCSINV